jgi:hypothetical protein
MVLPAGPAFAPPAAIARLGARAAFAAAAIRGVPGGKAARLRRQRELFGRNIALNGERAQLDQRRDRIRAARQTGRLRRRYGDGSGM